MTPIWVCLLQHEAELDRLPAVARLEEGELPGEWRVHLACAVSWCAERLAKVGVVPGPVLVGYRLELLGQERLVIPGKAMGTYAGGELRVQP